MAEHTPTPWKLDLMRWTPEAPVCGFRIISEYRHPSLPTDMAMHPIAGANNYEHSSFTACFTPEEIEANAAFIVKAVNNYRPLVDALANALCELSACAKQMGCTQGGSVHRAQQAARDILSRVSAQKEPS